MRQVCCTLCCCFSADRIDNSRVKSLEFEAKTSFSLHGFAGYFETVLYKDVTLSKFTSLNSPNVVRLAFIHSSPRPLTVLIRTQLVLKCSILQCLSLKEGHHQPPMTSFFEKKIAESALTTSTVIYHQFKGINSVLHSGIRPETHSEGMFSWFPFYFPIKVCFVYMSSSLPSVLIMA